MTPLDLPRHLEHDHSQRAREAHLYLVGEDRKGTLITFTNNEKLNPGWIQLSQAAGAISTGQLK